MHNSDSSKWQHVQHVTYQLISQALVTRLCCYRKALVDSGLSVRSLGPNSARGTRDEPTQNAPSTSSNGSMSARASPTPTALSASSFGAPPSGASSLSPYNAPMPAGKRPSIMAIRRGSMARKSVLGAQIGKGAPCPAVISHILAVSQAQHSDLAPSMQFSEDTAILRKMNVNSSCVSASNWVVQINDRHDTPHTSWLCGREAYHCICNSSVTDSPCKLCLRMPSLLSAP